MEIECPICLNNIDTNQECLTKCNHQFCYNCLHKWLTINTNCPTCREVVETFKYNDEINRVFIVTLTEDAEILNNIEELRGMLRNSENYNQINKKLFNGIKILGVSSILLLSSFIYLGVYCSEY